MLGSSQLLSTYFAIEWGLLLQREEAPVFSQHIVPGSSSMPLLPVPALLGAGRHFGNSLLLALSSRFLFFSPPLLVAIKNIMNLSQHFNPVFPPPPPAPFLMLLFYPSQHCVANPIQSNAVYRMLAGSLQRSSFKWQAPAQPAAQRWSLGDACCLHAGP